MGLESNPSSGSYADKEEKEYALIRQALKHYLREIEALREQMINDGELKHTTNEVLRIARHHMLYLSSEVNDVAHYIFKMILNVGKE